MRRPITACLLTRDAHLAESPYTNLVTLADSSSSLGLSNQRRIEVRAALRQLAEHLR